VSIIAWAAFAPAAVSAGAVPNANLSDFNVLMDFAVVWTARRGRLYRARIAAVSPFGQRFIN
jgi:hypothetical protein